MGDATTTATTPIHAIFDVLARGAATVKSMLPSGFTNSGGADTTVFSSARASSRAPSTSSLSSAAARVREALGDPVVQLLLSVASVLLTHMLLMRLLSKAVSAAPDSQDESRAAQRRARHGVIAQRLERAGIQLADLPEREAAMLSRVIAPDEIDVAGFEDIAGLASAVATVKERVLAPLQSPELFTNSRLLASATGVLLHGPPGTGKTLLAKAVAKESGALFFSVSPAALLSKYYGESPQRIEALFSIARKLAPSIIFFDEIDGLLSSRSSAGNGGDSSEATAATKTTLLQCWDGIVAQAQAQQQQSNDTAAPLPGRWVCVIGASNLATSIDDAALRRMPCRVHVPLPDERGRADILRVLLRGEMRTPDARHRGPDAALDAAIALSAASTPGFSGADLAEVVRVAAFRPIREVLEQRRRRSETNSSRGGSSSDSSGGGAVRSLEGVDLVHAVTEVWEGRRGVVHDDGMLMSGGGGGGVSPLQPQRRDAAVSALLSRFLATQGGGMGAGSAAGAAAAASE